MRDHPEGRSWKGLYTGACLALWLSLVTAGCNRTPPGLITAEDMAPAEAYVAQRVAHYQGVTCLRPVLRGAALPGPAAPQIIEVMEGVPETEACFQFLKANKGAVMDALILGMDGELESKGGPKRLNRAPAPLARPGSAPSVLDEVTGVCVPLVSRLQEAVSREDGCSPYLPGRRSVPGDMSPILDAARAVAATARTLARDGQREAAVSVLLDGLQFMYDVRRGGSEILAMGVAVAGSTLVAGTLEALLNGDAPLGRSLLDRITRELTVLVDSAPHPLDWVEASGVSTAIYTAQFSLGGPGWIPPGGWGRGGSAHYEGTDLTGLSPDDPGPQGFQFLILAASAGASDWASACPREESPLECMEGLRSLLGRLSPDTELNHRWERRSLSWSSDEQRREILASLVRGVRYAPVAHLLRHLPREGTLSLMVAGTRLAAALRARVEETGACPEAAALNQDSALTPYLQDPYSRSPFRVVSHPEGWLVVSSREPTFFHNDERPTRTQPGVVLRCASPSP